MTLRALGDGPMRGLPDENGARSLAPSAPPSPGTIPLELAEYLDQGEALLWWGEKDRIDYRPVAILLGLAVLLLIGVSLIVPEFWSQRFSDLWPPLAAILSPAVFVWLRERSSLRATIVTDVSIIDVPRKGRADRLHVRNVRAVRRDFLRGGIRLDGARHRVRIPPILMDDARAALQTQRHATIRQPGGGPSDPLGWLP